MIINSDKRRHLGIFESEKGRNSVVFGQIWLNFGFKKVIHWL